MFKLIRLEYKKFKLEGMLNGVVIADLCVLGLILLISIASQIDGEEVFNNTSEMITLIDVLVMATFIIYGSALLAKLTVSEYKNKTIQLMFMYPINRKKLFISKLIIVYFFAAFNIIVSNIFVLLGVSIADYFIDMVPGKLSLGAVLNEWEMLASSIVMSGFLAIVPLYFGMRKKSTAHTIIASVIIVSMLSSSFGPSIANSYYFLRILVLGGIAMISCFLSLNYTLDNIDTVGIES